MYFINHQYHSFVHSSYFAVQVQKIHLPRMLIIIYYDAFTFSDIPIQELCTKPFSTVYSVVLQDILGHCDRLELEIGQP